MMFPIGRTQQLSGVTVDYKQEGNILTRTKVFLSLYIYCTQSTYLQINGFMYESV